MRPVPALLLLAFSAGCDAKVLDLGGSAGGGPSDSSRIVLLLDGKQLATGGNASCLRRIDGSVKCWGQNDRGQLGVATDQLCGSLSCTRQPFTAPQLAGASRIALGGRFGCAIESGAVRCWGENTFGELARGTHDDDAHLEPFEIGLAAAEIWLGSHHGCALAENGQVHCWGLGEDGQLGLAPEGLERCGVPAELRGQHGVPVAADAACATQPQPVPAFEGAQQLALGDAHTCARFAGGRVACVGRGDSGQLGDGSSNERALDPVVAIEGGASEVQAGARHTCAIVNARAQCWGANETGQLGVGSIAQETCMAGNCLTRPSALGDLPRVEQLALGDLFSCAALQDGSVRCWGADSVGQLGNSSAQNEVCETPNSGAYDCQRRPLSAAYDLKEAVELRAGASHACALIHDELRCWGSSEAGQTAGREDLTFPFTVYGLN